MSKSAPCLWPKHLCGCRAIRSAEAFRLRQETVAWMRLSVRVGQDGLTRTVRRHDVEADGTASAARGQPGCRRGAAAHTPAPSKRALNPALMSKRNRLSACIAHRNTMNQQAQYRQNRTDPTRRLPAKARCNGHATQPRAERICQVKR